MDHANITTILEQGVISVEGRFLWGSNYTLLAQVTLGEDTIGAVYKPTQGERPLWDFPADTLAHREAAAYLVSEALKWSLVPPTIYRKEAPLGAGSLQYYIEHEPEYHFFNFSDEHRARLRPIAAFDLVVNNADRKGGHLLVDADDHIWAIDHGVCFHHQIKLRTVLWDFAGETVPAELCYDLELFKEALTKGSLLEEQLLQHLSSTEIKAMRRRTERLLTGTMFPHPPHNTRPYPWPLV